MKNFSKKIVMLALAILFVGLLTGFGQTTETFIPSQSEKDLLEMQIQFNLPDSIFQEYIKGKELNRIDIYRGNNAFVLYSFNAGKFGRVWYVEKTNSIIIIDSTTTENIVGYPFTRNGKIVYSKLVRQ